MKEFASNIKATCLHRNLIRITLVLRALWSLHLMPPLLDLLKCYRSLNYQDAVKGKICYFDVVNYK